MAAAARRGARLAPAPAPCLPTSLTFAWGLSPARPGSARLAAVRASCRIPPSRGSIS